MPRYLYKKSLCILISVITIFSIINHDDASPLKAIILLSLYFCYVFLQFKGQFIHKLLVIFPFFTIQIISEILVGYIISYIPFLDLTKNAVSTGYVIGIVFSNLILLFFSIAYVYLSKYLKMNDLPKYTWFIFILPILTIILLVNVNDYFTLFKSNPNALIYIVILVLFNLTFAIIFLLAINSTYMKIKLKTAEHKEELINSKFDLLTQHYSYNFNFLHDLLHTCNKLNLFLDNSDYNNIKEEIEKLSTQTFKEFNTIYTNSVTLNYIINVNLNRIKESGINIKTVLEYNNFENLDFYTQLQLFDFLIIFSIECCMKVDISQRIVIFKSKIKSNHIILQLLLPNVKANIYDTKKKIKKILNNVDYTINVKEVDSSSVSLLISFPVHTNNQTSV